MSTARFDIVIEEASLEQGRARVANFGPSGCGKTFTSLMIADTWAVTLKAEPFVVIDTEHGTASKYIGTQIPGADGQPSERRFKFSRINLKAPFSPDHYIAALKTAEAKGFKVCMIDSISHEWFAEGGAQQMADEAGARMGGNKWAGWSVATPAHNRFLEAILGSDMHIIATMRSKTEWVQVDGKPKKVGLGPIQRENIEYEFDIVLQQDMDHSVVVLKSRAIAVPVGIEVEKPGPTMAAAIMDWLQQGEPLIKPEQQPAEASTNGTASETEDEGPAIKPATKSQITKAVKALDEKHPDYEKLALKGEDGEPLLGDDGEPQLMNWDTRMTQMLPQLYKKEKVEDLTDKEGKDLVGKLQDTVVQLDERKAKAEPEGSLA